MSKDSVSLLNRKFFSIVSAEFGKIRMVVYLSVRAAASQDLWGITKVCKWFPAVYMSFTSSTKKLRVKATLSGRCSKCPTVRTEQVKPCTVLSYPTLVYCAFLGFSM